jgi:uncharacterized protein (DUF1499 family)
MSSAHGSSNYSEYGSYSYGSTAIWNELPSTPNCVSTTTKQVSKKMHPIRMGTLGSREVLEAIKRVVTSQKRAAVVRSSENSLECEFTSFLCGFVDDVVFVLDAGLIHFSSRSRMGYGDMGVNRRRMTKLTALIKEELKAVAR